MELRNRNRYHFIKAIKDGSIERVLNADTRGRPKLNHRALEDIYEKATLINDEWHPNIQPRVAKDLDHVPDVTDGSRMLPAEMNIKHEPEDCDVELKSNIGQRDGTCDDLGFGDMTLEQILKQCKGKKRKRQKHRHSEMANSDSHLKQEYPTLQPGDDRRDLEEPLCNWATGFSYRRKNLSVFRDAKSESCEDCYTVSDVVTFIPVDPLPDCNEEPRASAVAPIEIPRTLKAMEEEINYASNEFQATMRDECCVVDKVALENQENGGPESSLSASVSGEEITRWTDNSEGTGQQNSDFSIVESRKNSWADNPISNKSQEKELVYENEESIESKPNLGMKVTGWEIVKVDSPEILAMDDSGLSMVDFQGGKPYISEDKLEGTHPQNSDFPVAESGNNGWINGPISANTSLGSEEANNCGESIHANPDVCMKVTGWEIVKVETPEILAIDYSGLPMVDFGEENDIISPLSYDFSETDCLERNCHLEGNLVLYSANYLSSSEGQVQELDIDQTGYFLQYWDLKNAESSCETEDVAMDDLPDGPEAGHLLQSRDLKNTESSCGNEDIARDDLADAPVATVNSQLANCYYSKDSSHSCPEDFMTSVDEEHMLDERQSASSGYLDTAGDSESTRSSSVSEMDSIKQQKLHRPPEKLFSGRKVISPTSQARLRKAMEHPGSLEKTSDKCKGKLCFGSQNARRILKADRLGYIERVKVTSNSKQFIQKPNNLRPKASSKVSRRSIQVSTPPRRFSSGCTSLQGCSHNAIAFSQRQMQDIQNIAAKLTYELKSMKEITKRCLQAEGSPSKLSKRSAVEVKLAIKNAEKAQETSRKWLSIMERDCNRFCKLMGMISEDSPATENVALKERKRVKFADDAGGDLCHVKFFEIDLESPSLSEP